MQTVYANATNVYNKVRECPCKGFFVANKYIFVLFRIVLFYSYTRKKYNRSSIARNTFKMCRTTTHVIPWRFFNSKKVRWKRGCFCGETARVFVQAVLASAHVFGAGWKRPKISSQLYDDWQWANAAHRVSHNIHRRNFSRHCLNHDSVRRMKLSWGDEKAEHNGAPAEKLCAIVASLP